MSSRFQRRPVRTRFAVWAAAGAMLLGLFGMALESGGPAISSAVLSAKTQAAQAAVTTPAVVHTSSLAPLNGPPPGGKGKKPQCSANGDVQPCSGPPACSATVTTHCKKPPPPTCMSDNNVKPCQGPPPTCDANGLPKGCHKPPPPCKDNDHAAPHGHKPPNDGGRCSASGDTDPGGPGSS